MAALTIPTIFTAIDKFTAPLRGMTQATQSFASKAEIAVARADRAFNRLTPAIGGAMKQFLQFASAAAISGAIVGGVAFSARSVMDYEKSLASLSAITGVTGEAFEAFKGQVATVATDTRKSAIDVAKAFEIVGSAKPELLANADGLAAVTSAAITLSKASGDTLEASALSVTGVMNQFGLSAEEAARTMNVLAAGSKVGSANIQRVSESMVNFGAVASGANISLEQSVALIEVMGSKSLFGAEAGTKLRGSILKLQQAGVGYASGQFEINDALTEARKQIDLLGSAQEKDAAILKMFGAENITTGKILLDNIALFQQYTDGVTGTNTATEQAAINSDTLSARLGELQAAWVNMVTGSEQAGSSLNSVKTIIKFVTDNLSEIVGVVGTAIAVMIAWKSAILLTKGALVVYNAIANAIFLVDMVKYTASTQGLTVAQAALAIAQGELNTIMAANPMGLMVIGIAALIAVVVVAISYWNQFGAALIAVGAIIAAVFSPALAVFGLVLSIIMSIYHNWTNIVEAFKGGGILEGIKMIGKVLLDAVLNPLQQIINLIAKVTGFDWASNAAKSLENFRADMGVNVAQSEPVAAVNPKQAEQEAMVQRMETVSRQNVSIGIADETGRAKVNSDSGGVPITLTSTQAWQ
jgi:TP901 family phage tail tape measure protein